MKQADYLPLYRVDAPRKEDRLHFLQEIIPLVQRQGLKAAVVRLTAETNCGESDFAGATFPLSGADLFIWSLTSHLWVDETPAAIKTRLVQLGRSYDLVLVDGGGELDLRTIWLGPRGETAREVSAPNDLFLDDVQGNLQDFARQLMAELASRLENTPVWACILIGGQSSRMGRPKHLLRNDNGETWLEQTVKTVRPYVDHIVFAGQKEVPDGLDDIARLPDSPQIGGPLAGLLSAVRWQPSVSWLLLACDMPDISGVALQWLLANRAPGCWAIVPHHPEKNRLEPLLAWYDMRCLAMLEELAGSGSYRMAGAAQHERVSTPDIPVHLRSCWRNINRPGEL